MNKMNIPAPFRMALPTPPLPTSTPVPPPAPPLPPPVAARTNMNVLSSSESEMESSDEVISTCFLQFGFMICLISVINGYSCTKRNLDSILSQCDI